MAPAIGDSRRLSPRETGKFGLLVGLCAIFIDAVIAHGLFWDNDPYWTYWITKSFLITTVFVIGVAFLGLGIVQGLVITAAHTLILEIYYQWLSPVGLPQEPEWLDFNHLWTTGVPVHYLAIFTGYLMALWLWRRAIAVDRVEEARAGEGAPRMTAAALAVSSLVAAVVIIILGGIITHALLLGEFPGLTYFVQHLLTGFVFVYFWSAYVGAQGAGWPVGALMLSLLWAAYGMYLGPVGLPDHVHYLGYHDLWLRAFPGDFVAALIGLFVTIRLLPRVSPRFAAYAVPALILLAAAPDEARAKPTGLHAAATASGAAMRVTGPNPVDMQRAAPASGDIRLRVIEGGNRWSHILNQDGVELVANVAAPDGRYRIVVDKPMPRHPLGRYTTWNGVALNHEMHGDTGIGTSSLPRMKPEISIYGWGELYRDGQLISAMAPVHAMVTSKGPMAGVMLEVDTEDRTLRDVPGGYLTVMWPKAATVTMPKGATRQREIVGWIGLIGLALLFFALARREQRSRR